MAKHTIIISIQGNVIQNPVSFQKMLIAMKDGKWKLEASQADQRTLPQNAYLHGLLIPEFRKALNSVGYDEVKNDSQAKLIMKSMFLTAEIVNKETGEMIKYVKRTRDLSKEELNILIDEVIRFTAINMSYQIAYPNEQLTMNY